MEIEKNITSIFMVPTLKIPKDTLLDNGFINGYVRDLNRETEEKDYIYILFKPENIDKFREFLDDEYERTKSIIEDYDYKGGFVVVVYKLTPGFEKDFDLVREGKYSKTSENFQLLFTKVLKLIKNGLHRDELSLQYRIFNKTQDMVDFWEEKFGIHMHKNSEVWTGFIEKNEVLDIEKVKEEINKKVNV